MEVVFAVELGDGLDGAVEGEGGAEGGDEVGALEERLRAGSGGVEEGDVRVGRGDGGGGCGGGGEEFGAGVELGVDLNADG